MVETKADDNAKDSDNTDYNEKTLDEKKIEKYFTNNEKIHDEEKTEIESDEDSEDSVVKMISAAANTNDDPSLPCLTFRFWVLSTLFTALGAAVSVFYYFRSNYVNYSIFFVILASYILGKFMEKTLPTKKFYIKNWEFSLNPGPFNYKEHVCVAASAVAGGVSAYAVDIISIQELYYNTHVNFFIGFLLLISTQMIGYGLAGFARKSPNNNVIATLGSVYKGAGILNFSFDWNAISYIAPLYTPWWSQVNNLAGVVLATWIIAPLLYFNNVLDAQNFPFLSTHTFDKNGERYNQTRIIDPTTNTLDFTAYENYSPMFMSIILVACYGYSFMQIPATIVHVILFHGKDIWNRFKKTREEENESDIHCKMMSIYPEVPNYWYGGTFLVMLIIAIILGQTTGANLPWWGLLLAVALAVITLLPIGIIQAISNWQIGLNVIVEMVCGYILPGRPIANVYFKTYGYMCLSQCLYFVQDLKLGHYMKIPPRSMFTSQIWGTFVGVIINYWTMALIIDKKRPYLDGTIEDPSGQWTGIKSGLFNSASIIWGLIGPGITFGPSSPYNILLWGFLIGVFLPIPFYLLHRKFPRAKFNFVNTPVILNGLATIPESIPNFIITGFIVSFLSQFYAFRYKNKWWKKNNYVLSAAFDSGAQIMTMVLFICFTGIAQVQFPAWWGNDPSSQGEHCFYE
ncbi:14982_t:CDS:10 [Dentiscutata erythropus]|uniref:14982_t:CDS:1 n=1 Tax=Dentiscutata erythropus TaxID=1348616 RepID=A0A9N9DZG6_9GLOM|nr:14982_t:CDS:10 [Dentiscutata erythropus]